MFVRSKEDLPKDPAYPADLKELGYKVNEEGKFVQISSPNTFVEGFKTGNERANDVHREAVRTCAQKVMVSELAKHGVKEIYMTGEDGKEVVKVKPKGKHVAILTTVLEELKGKQDVIIVIGEHNRDMGIWAYRHVLKEGGIEGGSAVGLMEKLQVLGLDTTPRNLLSYISPPTDVGPWPCFEPLATSTPGEYHIEPVAWAMDRSGSVVTAITRKVPGVVILNPGQLLYSHELNKTMKLESWYARPKSSAIAESIEINEIHNHVPGHANATEHINTVFDHILPQIISSKANLYVVGITDGAENFIHYIDAKLCAGEGPHHEVGGSGAQVLAMAFMEPVHDPSKVKCRAVENLLDKQARAWIKSSRPFGAFLNSPAAANPIHGGDADISTAGSEVQEAYTEAGTLEGSIPGEMEKLSNAEYAAETLQRLRIEEPAATDAVSSTGAISTELAENMEDSYDYTTELVSCPTYSAGTDIDEMIWPKAMDAALDWFKFAAETAMNSGREVSQEGRSGSGFGM